MSRERLTVLMINKYYFVKGGSERYMFELTDLLQSRGHLVIPFSMEHPSNRSTPWSRHFVSRANFGEDGRVRARRAPGLLARAIYSHEAQRKLRGLLREVKPDVAHLHMIDHQISPSILPVLKNAGIPIIQTIHQYKAVCPSYRLYNDRTDKPCELCIRGSTVNAALTRCHKGSFVSSAALALESGIHRLARLNRLIDLFHAPSRFAARKLEEGGYDSTRTRCFPLAIDVTKRHFHAEPRGDIVYCGRLSPEKGLNTLLDAMVRLPDLQLSLIGEGPHRAVLESRVKQMELNNVVFRGRLDTEDLENAVSGAALSVVPSRWYENSPLAIYESFSLGTPVVGARIGGIPELVEEGRTGALFEPGNALDLAEKLRELIGDRCRLVAMRRACRLEAENKLDWKVHLPRIEACYQELLSGRNYPHELRHQIAH